jgi:hypothetical protein
VNNLNPIHTSDGFDLRVIGINQDSSQASFDSMGYKRLAPHFSGVLVRNPD